VKTKLTDIEERDVCPNPIDKNTSRSPDYITAAVIPTRYHNVPTPGHRFDRRIAPKQGEYYSMTTHRLRFFFDYGSGVCFWAANEAAQRQFGYPVETDQLPLSTATKEAVEHVISWYDQSLNWDDPGGPGLWNSTDWEQFNTEVQKILALVHAELGAQFEIINEYSGSSSLSPKPTHLPC
jgi:hypothetical protein